MKIRTAFSTALILLFFLISPAAAFDTYWHAQATQVVSDEFGFTKDATNVMKLGNFSPDLFGPVEDYASSHLGPEQRQGLQEFGLRNAKARAAAIFLHFDNLEGKLDRNSKFDYLFNQLLENTRNALAADRARTDLDEATRNTLILETLGASLHTVQDFYSHSDWIHNDFDSMPVKMIHTDSGSTRAPTWFQVRQRLGAPDSWPFTVKAGIYPRSMRRGRDSTAFFYLKEWRQIPGSAASGYPILRRVQNGVGCVFLILSIGNVALGGAASVRD